MRRSFWPSKLLALLPQVAALAMLSAVAACVAPPDGTAAQQGAVLDICATAPEGALCDDKNVCTIFDVCKGGVCKGSAAPDGTLCTDGNVCTANDSCRAGLCKGDPVPDTTACTDGDPCTVGDVCQAGTCLSGAATLACDDGVACTLDVCVAGFGCVFSPVGDCSLPKDAGPDVVATDAADGPPAVDVAADRAGDSSMMSGGDVAADRTSVTDTAPADGAAPDAPPDAAPDAPFDAPLDEAVDEALDVVAMDVVSPADAPGDVAPADAAGVDGGVADAAADADAAPEADAGPVGTLPLLRASGGACACATAEAPRSARLGLGVSALFVALVLGGRPSKNSTASRRGLHARPPLPRDLRSRPLVDRRKTGGSRRRR